MPTIAITLEESSNLPIDIAIAVNPPLQENTPIWVWDHYFSYALHHLSDEDEASQLMEKLATWAITFAPQMSLSFDELSQQNLLQLSPDIHLTPEVNNTQEEILIEATAEADQWPNIHIRLDKNTSALGLHYSALALAEFFLNTHPYFYRELPLHILAMRKFYQNELPFSDEDSVKQAPLYAFNVALKFQQSLNPEAS